MKFVILLIGEVSVHLVTKLRFIFVRSYFVIFVTFAITEIDLSLLIFNFAIIKFLVKGYFSRHSLLTHLTRRLCWPSKANFNSVL